MKQKSRTFAAVDFLYICMMVLPFVFAIVLKILTKPASEGISITGAQVYIRIPMPIQELVITEAQINSWMVMIVILGLCLYLTHGITAKGGSKRQIAAEWIVEACEKMVCGNMGEYFRGFSPFIAAILGLSALSSLSSLLGLFPPTSDVNITAGWAILVFVLITYYKLKCGFGMYVKGLCSPIAMTPLNVIGEIATPISMAFRHYGNVLSGSVIGVLIATGLQGLSHIVLGWLPGFLGEFPFLQVGLPAIPSLYFDLFSGVLQAYIFAMLTMLYVSGGFDIEEYERRKRKKRKQDEKQLSISN